MMSACGLALSLALWAPQIQRGGEGRHDSLGNSGSTDSEPPPLGEPPFSYLYIGWVGPNCVVCGVVCVCGGDINISPMNYYSCLHFPSLCPLLPHR